MAKAPAKKGIKANPPVRTVRTVRARATFLATLETTCNVAESARAAGMGRSAAYDWKRDDEAFAADWEQALESAADKLEQVAFERATAGHSDRMLEILLKAHRHKYRVKRGIELTGADGGPIEYRDLSEDEIEARIAARMAELDGNAGD